MPGLLGHCISFWRFEGINGSEFGEDIKFTPRLYESSNLKSNWESDEGASPGFVGDLGNCGGFSCFLINLVDLLVI